MTSIATIGHSNRTAEEFRALLAANGIGRLVDVRRFPSSKYNPQFNKPALAAGLAAANIAYDHVPTLGGRREASAASSRNGAWEEPAFRAYADFALTAEFQAALAALMDAARRQPVAIMCAERDWRHCHRQIVADYLLTRGVEIVHILGDGEAEPGRLSSSAEPQRDGTVLYPARQGELGLF
ncbi:MAG: DUF488 domain-containing protein [Rhodospirillaceae bacterium]|nr:DUF488 domain-containing protein [Rhodospirillaceae bacterium]